MSTYVSNGLEDSLAACDLRLPMVVFYKEGQMGRRQATFQRPAAQLTARYLPQLVSGPSTIHVRLLVDCMLAALE